MDLDANKNIKLTKSGKAWWLMKTTYAWLIVFALLGIGLYSWPMAMFGDMSRIPGDLGDARFNNYILEHFHNFLTGQVASLWELPSMYPYPSVLALSENHMGTGWFYSIFRQLGLDRENAYQMWILSMYALNYLCAFLAFRKWSSNIPLAACAAYIFAFGIHFIIHVDHVQMLSRAMMPLVFLWAWRWLQKGRTLHLALALFGLTLQFYCAIYLGSILLFALLLLLLVHVAFHIRQYRTWLGTFKSKWLSITIISVLALLLMLPLVIPYLEASAAVGSRNFEEVQTTLPQWKGYFFTHEAAQNWRDLSIHGQNKMDGWWNQFHFMGAVPYLGLLLALILVFKRGNPNRRNLAVLITVFFLAVLLCMDLGQFTLYGWIHAIPGFSAIRSVDRMVQAQLLLLLFVGLYAGSMIKLPKWLGMILVLGLPILVVLENKLDVKSLKTFDKYQSRKRIALAAKRIEKAKEKGCDAVVYMPVVNSAGKAYISKSFGVDDADILFVAEHLDAILAAQQIGIAVVNGYSGIQPFNFKEFFYALDTITLNKWLKANADTSNVQIVNNLGEEFISAPYATLSVPNVGSLTTDAHPDSWAFVDPNPEGGMQYLRSIELKDGSVAFLAANMRFLCAEVLEEGQISSTGIELGDFGKFHLATLDDGLALLKAFNGKYVSLHENGHFYAQADSAQNATRFKLEQYGSFPPN